MTKRLNPEIKALRALERAMQMMPADARQRGLEWFVSRWCGRSWIRLPRVTEGDTDE